LLHAEFLQHHNNDYFSDTQKAFGLLSPQNNLGCDNFFFEYDFVVGKKRIGGKEIIIYSLLARSEDRR
jgi:hypothetical protein